MSNRLPQAAKEKYSQGTEIARGKYGVVYKSESLETKSPLAIKVMLKKGNKKDDVMKEVAILKKLNHPGILQMMDFMECEKDYVLVTELLNGGELFEYVIKKDYLDEKEATFYMSQLLSAINYCHQNKIVHLDLKPENIVLKEKDGKVIKLIDFGTAQDLSINPNPKTMVGTPEFIAPEVLNYDPVSCAADMWAVGVITYVLLTGMSPFLGDDDMETVNNIATGEFEYPDPDPEEGYEDISDDAKDFIDSMLKKIPRDRADAQTCLKHRWLATSVSKMLGTGRLKSFKARRRWLAVTRAARLSISFSRMKLLSSKSSSTECEPSSPVSPGPDDAIN